MTATPLPSPCSAELLHDPPPVTSGDRLTQLITGALLTEFPVTRLSPAGRQVPPDEAVSLLRDADSPWRRRVWWSAEVPGILEALVRSGCLRLTAGRLLGLLPGVSLPRQEVSAVGAELTALSRLTSCSLACNRLTELRGGQLPRQLRQLQLYGNRLCDTLPGLLTDCPPLERLGLGRTQLTDDHLTELAPLLSSRLPSLRALDLSDNHISDLTTVTTLLTTAAGIRSISLCGNPAFLASGYYQHFLTDRGRLAFLDGIELTETALTQLQSQLKPSEEHQESAGGKKKKAEKSPKKQTSRRPPPVLLPSRFEPSLTSALIRITGVIYLPFLPKEQWPGQELCAVFQWSDEPNPAGASGLCPQEAPLLEKSDVTALEMPLEWHCGDLRALRDAMLRGLLVTVVRREKWTPAKKTKKGKDKSSKKEKEKGKKTDENKVAKGNKSGKEKKNNAKELKSSEGKPKESGERDGSSPDRTAGEAAPEEGEQPPPETTLGRLLLPVRPLLRPAGPLLLHGISVSSSTAAAPAPAAVTRTHWSEAVQNIQEEKKQRKAALKRAEKEGKAKGKKKSASVRSGSSRRKEKAPEPAIQCFFAVELYRKPVPVSDSDHILHMPIDDLE